MSKHTSIRLPGELNAPSEYWLLFISWGNDLPVMLLKACMFSRTFAASPRVKCLEDVRGRSCENTAAKFTRTFLTCDRHTNISGFKRCLTREEDAKANVNLKWREGSRAFCGFSYVKGKCPEPISGVLVRWSHPVAFHYPSEGSLGANQSSPSHLLLWTCDISAM